MYSVYIIYNSRFDKYYIGQTFDISKMIVEYNSGLSKYTAKYPGGWVLMHLEPYGTRREALNREKFLKNQKNKIFYKNLCSVG